MTDTGPTIKMIIFTNEDPSLFSSLLFAEYGVHDAGEDKGHEHPRQDDLEAVSNFATHEFIQVIKAAADFSSRKATWQRTPPTIWSVLNRGGLQSPPRPHLPGTGRRAHSGRYRREADLYISIFRENVKIAQAKTYHGTQAKLRVPGTGKVSRAQ